MVQAKELLQKKAENQIENSKKQNMSDMLLLMTDEIKKALPAQVSIERFQRIALTAFNGNNKLQQCNPVSFLAAMMQSAQLGLEPNTPLGQAYLIPYGHNVQFQIGYKGLLELAQRTNKYKNIQAQIVYENDEFDIEYGLNPVLKHIPFMTGDRGKVIGYYAVYNLTNGGQGFEYMTKGEVEKHAKKFSKTFNNGPWTTDFDEMAKKTVLKKLLKYAPMSTELATTVNIDEQLIDEKKLKDKKKNDKDINILEDVDWTYSVDEETGEILGE